MALNWYLIHSKPRQERVALQNFEQQGVEVYLPLKAVEAQARDTVTVKAEALFPRYLFIRLDDTAPALSWSAVRFTRGVSRLVCFGAEPARVDPALIERLKACEADRQQTPVRLFSPGSPVRVTRGPFAGLDAVYQMADGDRRAIVLIELLSRSVSLAAPVADLRRLG